MNNWIDFREIRKNLRFADVLHHYKVEVKIKGEQLVGHCPLPNHESKGNVPSLSVNPARGIFQCFGCKAHGNVLDFACLMEGADLQNGGEVR